MKPNLVFASLALTSLSLAQTFSDLPSCAQTCMLALTDTLASNFNCTAKDATCLCWNNAWSVAVKDCVSRLCPDHPEYASGYITTYCRNYQSTPYRSATTVASSLLYTTTMTNTISYSLNSSTGAITQTLNPVYTQTGVAGNTGITTSGSSSSGSTIGSTINSSSSSSSNALSSSSIPTSTLIATSNPSPAASSTSASIAANSASPTTSSVIVMTSTSASTRLTSTIGTILSVTRVRFKHPHSAFGGFYWGGGRGR